MHLCTSALLLSLDCKTSIALMEVNRALQFEQPLGISKRFRTVDHSENLKAVARMFGTPFALSHESNDEVNHVHSGAIESYGLYVSLFFSRTSIM